MNRKSVNDIEKGSLTNLGTFKDPDGSIKNVFELGNKKIIEVTLLVNKIDKDVVCVPTHHFCNLGCKMCHLTNNKLNKKMEPIQYKHFMEALLTTLAKPNGEKRTQKKKLLISFMGVGEPLLNLKLLQDVFENESFLKGVYGYDSISYALSTMMPNRNINSLLDITNYLNVPLKIHFSLHSPINEERFNLIPSAQTTIITAFQDLYYYGNNIISNSEIMQNYMSYHNSSFPVEIHYTLIKGINDSVNHLSELKKILNVYKFPIKFIRFNPINDLSISENEQHWISELSKIEGLRVKTYTPPGKLIGSSCGEFTRHYYHEEIETPEELEEFKQWETEYRIYE